MNDQDVRDFLEVMSAEEPVPFIDAESLTRRARRRAVRTVVVGAVGVVVAIAALIAGTGVIGSAPTETPERPSVVWRTGGELPTDVVGGTTTATFDAFGSSWSITHDQLITLQGPLLGNGKVFRSLSDGQSSKVDV